MPMLQSLSLISVFSVSLAISGAVYADDSKRLTRTLEYREQVVELDVEVGQAQLIATDEQAIRVEVDIKASETSWFELFGSTDVADIELATSVSDNKIRLALSDQGDINQTWRVYLPRNASVIMDMGVGQVEVDGMQADVDIDVGVGTAEVSYSHEYQKVELKSGVGEVRVDDNMLKHKVIRNLVSQSVSWQAPNYHQDMSELNVKVGVGEVIATHL